MKCKVITQKIDMLNMIVNYVLNVVIIQTSHARALTDTSLKELAAYARVFSHRVSDFRHVGTGRFTHRRHGVDGRDSLSEESIGCLTTKEPPINRLTVLHYNRLTSL